MPEELITKLGELIYQIQGNYRPDVRTIKNRLFQKFGDDVVIAETSIKKCIDCFKDVGYKILTESWYQNQKSDPEAGKLRILKTAADIILDDIRSKIYNTNEFTPPNSFLVDVESVIPEFLLLFFQTILLKNKRSALDKWKKQCIALSHALITAVRPRLFISLLLHAVGVYLYQKFDSKQLMELLSNLGFAASYKDTAALQVSAILRPDQLRMNEDCFLQFIFDNADFNVNTIEGLRTFLTMGGIMEATPYNLVAPDTATPDTKCSSSELVKKHSSIQLEVYHKQQITGFNIAEIADVHTHLL